MTTRRPLLVVLAVLVLLATGCSDGDDEGAPQGPEDTTQESTSAPGPPPTAKPVEANLPQAATLDLQANHPNGTSLRVTKVAFFDDHIQVELSVTNGSPDNDIELNKFGDEMFLRDDLGTVYRMSPPPQNPEVGVPPATTTTGTFAFLGRVAPGASNLSLSVNGRTGSDTYEEASDPQMTVTGIPVERA